MHGRSAIEAATHRNRAGFGFTYSLPDDPSRQAQPEVHPDEEGATHAGFLLRPTSPTAP